MIGSTRAVRVFAYTQPVDLRKGYAGLEGIVRHKMGKDLLQGDLFLFTSRYRYRAKVLLFDGTGLCIYSKRIDRGRFAKLRSDGDVITMTTTELALFLEGSELVGRKRLSPEVIPLARVAGVDRM